MDISVVTGNILEFEADAVILNLFEGVTEPGGATGAADRAMDGAIQRLISGGDFTGKKNQTGVLYPTSGVDADRVILVGLGKEDAFSLEGVRQASAKAARFARDLGARRVATVVHGAGAGGLAPGGVAQAVVEGAVLGTYRFTEYKTAAEDQPSLESFALVELDSDKASEMEAGAEFGEAVSGGACLARDLANHPGNSLTPTRLGELAQEMAGETGLRCEVLDEAAIEREGMRTIQAVARGSNEPPRFLVLEHEGAEPEAPPVVIIGKGITFDTGGISLKGSDKMWDMKFDMGGAAAVMGTMQAVARLGLPQRTVGLIAAAENMPGGNALRPGDVIRSMLGKTIEIRSTDAEGRLVLADGLCYAARYEPCAAIDLATLTGACVTALGHDASGLMGNDEELAAEVSRAGDRSGEIAWRLPILDGHREVMKSEVADLKNTGIRAGGALNAAAFLEAFVQDFPWAHLDIAGTAWTDAEKPYCPAGATGVGIRLLIEFLRGRAPAGK